MNNVIYLFLPSCIISDIDECVNHTCQNGGSCLDGNNKYTCKCLAGFTGYHCEAGEFIFTFRFCLRIGQTF